MVKEETFYYLHDWDCGELWPNQPPILSRIHLSLDGDCLEVTVTDITDWNRLRNWGWGDLEIDESGQIVCKLRFKEKVPGIGTGGTLVAIGQYAEMAYLEIKALYSRNEEALRKLGIVICG